MLPVSELRERVVRFARAHRRWLMAFAAAVGVLGLYPFLAGGVGAGLVAGRLSDRLGVPVEVGQGRAGFGALTLANVTMGHPDHPVALIDELVIPFSVAWSKGTVRVVSPRIKIERGSDADNVASILKRLSKPGSASGTKTGGSIARLPLVRIERGTLQIDDRIAGRTLTIGTFDAEMTANQRLRLDARNVVGTVRLRGGEGDPNFGAKELVLEVPLVGLRPAPFPDLRVVEGYVRVLPTLPLTGIRGTVRRVFDEGAQPRLMVDLEGSYGGAKQTLWTASGTVLPLGKTGQEGHPPEGTLSLKAERFSLDRIADVLPLSILQPRDTSVDAVLDFHYENERLGFSGNLDVTGLNVHHEKLASEPLIDLAFAVRIEGVVEPKRRRFELVRLEGRLGALVGEVAGSVELAPGVFRHADGTEMPFRPKIAFALRVPKLPCAKLLGSLPAPVIPYLKGFVLQGNFEANVRADVDFANLDALDLGGKVAIDGCRVTGAPELVTSLAGPDSIVQMVEVPPRPGEGGAGPETMTFTIGPDNPDFVPFSGISPHLINAIMTTEDSGFFKHRGWVSSVFKTALRRNLENGGFRLGASSITMQMVKNVLLSHEKTLSRKLQELFLVWYLEQLLPKERILELYFNAIEFGPRLYGIGPAARHYFGKAAADLTPLEAAFFSSILPSPKRRYIQYCHGSLYPPWDKYVRRIMARVHERGRLGDEEYAAASAAPFAFDLTERTMTEKECLAWVKEITQRPTEADLYPDAESP